VNPDGRLGRVARHTDQKPKWLPSKRLQQQAKQEYETFRFSMAMSDERAWRRPELVVSIVVRRQSRDDWLPPK